MTATEKLILASMGTKALGAMLAPTMAEEYTEAKRWRGSYYGVNADGSGAPAAPPPAAQRSTPQQGGQQAAPAAPIQQAAAPQRQMTPAQPVNTPAPVMASRELMPSPPSMQQANAVNTVPELPAAPAAKAPSAPIQNSPIEAKQLMEPGVRYV